MVWQLAELEYKAKRISDWRVGGRASRASRLRRDNRPAISGLHPTSMKGMAMNSVPQLRLNYYSAM